MLGQCWDPLVFPFGCDFNTLGKKLSQFSRDSFFGHKREIIETESTSTNCLILLNLYCCQAAVWELFKEL